LDNVVSFVTEPKGVFQTMDAVIETFRETNRETLRELGVPRVLGERRFFKGRRIG